jgi:hypothetical protein
VHFFLDRLSRPHAASSDASASDGSRSMLLTFVNPRK